MTSQTDPPSPPLEPSAEVAEKPLPLQLELPAGDGVHSPSMRPPELRARSRHAAPMRALGVLLGGLFVCGIAGAATFAWGLPWYLHRACVEAAGEHGIAMTIERVELVPRGFKLYGVTARSSYVPSASARAPEVDVSTSGLRPRDVAIRGGDLTLHGSLAAIAAELTRWQRSVTGGQGGAWAPTTVSMDGAHVDWLGAIGDTVRVEGSDVHAEFVWRRGESTGPGSQGTAAPSETHLRSTRVSVALPGSGGPLGPWRIDLDRSASASRLRLALDPDVPESSSLLIVGDGEQTTSVDLSVPRAPLAHLGLGGPRFGWDGSAVQGEATMHYVVLGPARSDVTAKGGLFGLGIAGLPAPVDVTWRGSARGDPRAGIDVKNAELAAGPLSAPLRGTLKTFDDGFRITLAWAAGPVDCDALPVPVELALGLPGVLPSKIVSPSGASRGKTASAGVTFSFDSRDLSATKIEFKPDIACTSLTSRIERPPMP